MAQTIILTCAVLCSVSGFTQNTKADNLYDRGVNAFNNNVFNKADSLK